MSAASPTPTAGTDTRHSGLLVLFLSLGGLAFAVLQSLVAPTIGTLAADLKVSSSSASWVITAYLLSASVLTPVLGRLGDIAGKRKVLIGVLAVLLIGTLIAAVAPNLTVLIIGRVLQGAAGGIMPLSIGIVRDELPPEKVGVTVGLLSAIFGIGAGIGIVSGGPIVEHLSWHWLFWLPLVLVVIALVGVVFGLKESSVRSPGRLDLVGSSILSVGLVALLLAVSKGEAWGWGDVKTVGLLGLGAVGLVVFVLVERKVSAPLIDMRLMSIRGVWATDVVALVLGFAMFGTFLLVPTLLQLPTATGYGFGKTVSQAGLFLLPTIVMMIFFGPLAGALARRYGPKLPMVLGTLAVVAGFTLPALSHGSLWQVIASGVLVGIGIGLAFAAMSNAIIATVPASQTGEASSVNTIARTIGSSIGTAVISALLASGVTAQGLPTDATFTKAFWVCAVVAAVAVVAALVLPSLRTERSVTARTDGAPADAVGGPTPSERLNGSTRSTRGLGQSDDSHPLPGGAHHPRQSVGEPGRPDHQQQPR